MKHPILGTGLKPGRVNVTTHNFHIEWLQYGGIIGGILGTGIFLSFFLLNRSTIQKDPYRVAIFCIIAIVLMNCMTNGIMHGYRNIVIFGLIGMTEARRLIMNASKN